MTLERLLKGSTVLLGVGCDRWCTAMCAIVTLHFICECVRCSLLHFQVHAPATRNQGAPFMGRLALSASHRPTYPRDDAQALKGVQYSRVGCNNNNLEVPLLPSRLGHPLPNAALLRPAHIWPSCELMGVPLL